ncbi:endospore germination permease [Paenibacillus allorhizosphaerae]|uniref:Spore germination protein YndE n=1 Tax=Paenibacillus allorhizosphaerae TaxID=2849866 RepID=A0ABM8VGG6_9BACL|nr:endospore germination permease [Paenibacillus allorhizosphaerae]CAG7638355.1 Spore germination protein YndE [Paenibacillus allorhizosphaerae]
MQFTRQITTIQAAAILVSTIIGVGVLPLPLFAVRAADSGAPLVTLLAMMLAFVGLALVALLGMRFPNKSIIQYSEDIIGKWPAWIGSLFIIAFFAMLTSLTAREFGEVVVTSVLKTTPVEVTVIVMLVLAAISTRNDLTTFAYIHHFYFPALLGPALLIVALSLKNAEMINLQPIWGNEPKGMMGGVLTIAALFQGSFILTAVIPAMRRPEKAMKASILGMLIAGGLYVAIVIATVSVFGAEESKLLLWPTLELAKATSLPANILERLDAAFLAVWVTAVFTTLFSSYYLTIHSMSKLFRLRDHRMFSLFLLPIVFVMAMLPLNILHMYEIIQNVGRIGLIITIAYPGALLLISIIRKKRGDRVGNNPMDQSA